MQSAKIIEHKGVIDKITDKSITVRIEVTSACGSCDARGICGITEGVSKAVDVENPHKNYAVGDTVTVILDQSLGFKALFLGYLLPFLILILTLIVASYAIKREAIAGIIALTVLIPYYFGLYIFRRRLQKTFKFAIKE